jgi:hypothetical protein
MNTPSELVTGDFIDPNKLYEVCGLLGWHPNLVQAIGVTNQKGRLYICMEYIEPNEEGLNSLDGYLAKVQLNSLNA